MYENRQKRCVSCRNISCCVTEFLMFILFKVIAKKKKGLKRIDEVKSSKDKVKDEEMRLQTGFPEALNQFSMFRNVPTEADTANCCAPRLQDWRSGADSVLVLRGGAGSGEERRASELAVHVLDDRRNLRLGHGLGHHPALR